MRFLKYLVLLAALALPAAYSQAQVSVGVELGTPGYVYGPPPVCEFGYYPDAPYACAPYGYWGPEYFVDGYFIGVGPWYRYYYRHPEFFVGFGPAWHRFHGRRFDRDRDFDRGFRRFDRDRGFERRRFADRDGFRRFEGRRADNGFRGRETFHGGEAFRGGTHHDGGSFHSGGGHGGGESHGGGHGGGSHGDGHSGGHRSR